MLFVHTSSSTLLTKCHSKHWQPWSNKASACIQFSGHGPHLPNFLLVPQYRRLISFLIVGQQRRQIKWRHRTLHHRLTGSHMCKGLSPKGQANPLKPPRLVPSIIMMAAAHITAVEPDCMPTKCLEVLTCIRVQLSCLVACQLVPRWTEPSVQRPIIELPLYWSRLTTCEANTHQTVRIHFAIRKENRCIVDAAT
jgi:hypothetical protein